MIPDSELSFLFPIKKKKKLNDNKVELSKEKPFSYCKNQIKVNRILIRLKSLRCTSFHVKKISQGRKIAKFMTHNFGNWTKSTLSQV